MVEWWWVMVSVRVGLLALHGISSTCTTGDDSAFDHQFGRCNAASHPGAFLELTATDGTTAFAKSTTAFWSHPQVIGYSTRLYFKNEGNTFEHRQHKQETIGHGSCICWCLCHCMWWWPWRVKRWPATQTCFVPPIILTSLEGNFWRPSAYKACMQTCTFTCKANLPVSLVEIAISLPQVLPCRCDMLWYYDILWGCLTSIPMPHLLETYSSSSCFLWVYTDVYVYRLYIQHNTLVHIYDIYMYNMYIYYTFTMLVGLDELQKLPGWGSRFQGAEQNQQTKKVGAYGFVSISIVWWEGLHSTAPVPQPIKPGR